MPEVVTAGRRVGDLARDVRAGRLRGWRAAHDDVSRDFSAASMLALHGVLHRM